MVFTHMMYLYIHGTNPTVVCSLSIYMYIHTMYYCVTIFFCVEAIVVSCIHITKQAYCTFANMFLFIVLSHWGVLDSFVSLDAVSVILFIVWGSWLAVKRSLTHYPSSQGWASLFP